MTAGRKAGIVLTERGMLMLLYFAPMEGVTGYLYRNVHAAFFPGVDQYYAPFIAPDGSGNFRAGHLRDILPENNRDLRLVPQILCSRPEPFLKVARELAAMGYQEVNLNAGCPSGTVVPKRKGAGMLADLQALDGFLAEVFSRCPLRVSVKTRMGLESTGEFPAILEIYNRYPLAELIIHARDRAGMYRSCPDRAEFAEAFAASRSPVVYNGNLVSAAERDRVLALVPGLDRLMIGRGAAADPSLFRQLRGGSPLSPEELRSFLEALCAAMEQSGLGSHYTLGRLKELWYYVSHLFPGGERLVKAINKAQSLSDYRSAVHALFASGSFDPAACFRG